MPFSNLACQARLRRSSFPYRYPRSEASFRRQLTGCAPRRRFFSTCGHTCVSAPANASVTSRKTLSHACHTRRIFGNGSESCPRGALRCFGGSRAAKPARAKPSGIAFCVSVTSRHFIGAAHLGQTFTSTANNGKPWRALYDVRTHANTRVMRMPCQTNLLTFSRWFYVALPGSRHSGAWRPAPRAIAKSQASSPTSPVSLDARNPIYSSSSDFPIRS